MKKLPIGLLLLSLISLCFARSITSLSVNESKPDLGGNWKLDLSLSDFAGTPKNDLLYDDLTLAVFHSEPEVKITRKISKKKRERSQELIYFSDGRGESNPSLDGKERVTSNTHWEGDILISISKGKPRAVVPGALDTVETTDSWELSPNGNMLIHTTQVKVVRGPERRVVSPDNLLIRRVFRRVS